MHDWEEQFRLRVGRMGDDSAAVRRVGRITPGRLARRGRGARVMTPLRQKAAGAAGLRRVVVKARIVKLRSGSGALRAHLAYLERDAREPGESRGRIYSALSDEAGGAAFLKRSQEDRHQFRFIISPEDGAELDLQSYTRELMGRMQRDLNTKLDWIAVDHADTAHPHTHLIIRGKTERGADLLISQDYITEGLRLRARELATEHLGPRTEREIREKAWREVGQERFTGLDRTLLRDAPDGVIDLRSAGPDAALKAGRLSVLEDLGLAHQAQPGLWKLSPDLEAELRWRGERGDIIKTMNRALARQGQTRDVASFVTHGGEQQPVVGQVIDKGLSGPTEERAALFIDGVDGKLRRIEVSLQAASEVRVGAIVQAGVGPTVADRTIVEIAKDGLYRTDEHLRRLAMGELSIPQGAGASDIVASHERRLEALKRARIVSRYEPGRWSIPEDFLQKASDYEARRGIVRVLSPIDLDRQVASRGATWLDRQLVASAPIELADRGFGAEVKATLEKRTEVLERQGLARRMGQDVTFSGGLLQTLAQREVSEAGEAYAMKSGLAYWTSRPGEWVQGTYAGKLELDSGSFAIIREDSGFRLAPWRPVIEPRLGQQVRGNIEQGLGVSWDLSRSPEKERDGSPGMHVDDGFSRGRRGGLSL